MGAALNTDPEHGRANCRVAVLLKASDRKKLKRLAAQEKVSASEIVRRSIHSYQSPEDRIHQAEEDRIIRAVLILLEESMGGKTESMANTLAKLDRLQEELNELERRRSYAE